MCQNSSKDQRKFFATFFILSYFQVVRNISSNIHATSKEIKTRNRHLECPLLNSESEAECQELLHHTKNFFSDSNVLRRIQDPDTYFSSIKTVAFDQVSEEEANFPLAFSIVTHGHLGILEAQLATLFRSHNAYCIYIDRKASPTFVSSVKQLLNCYLSKFPQSLLFVAPQPIPIFWSDFSLLEADLQCMKHMLEKHSTWEYFINQAGTAMPAVTLSQLVSIIRGLRGRDSIRSRPFPLKYSERIKYVYKRPVYTPKEPIDGLNGVKEMSISQLHMYSLTPKKTFQRKEKPPLGLTLFKGLKESIISRKSADFFLNAQVSKALLQWSLDILFPEEIFFQTLCRIDQDLYYSKGIIQQDKSPTLDMNRGLCVRRTLWEDTVKGCHGKMKRYICNLALADMPQAFEKKCLFLNKFGVDVDGSVITCLQQHLTNNQSLI